MINLPFSCHCSELKVYPNNWNNKNASIKKDWYVFYRFYDPNFRNIPRFKNGKLIIIKRMNRFKSIPERQGATHSILELEMRRLKEMAFNPITNKCISDFSPQMDLTPSSTFITALTIAEKRISASASTKRDLRSVLKYVTNAATHLGYSNLPIASISRKNIKQVLTHIDLYHGESAHRYNKIRSYLMILYKELIELEVVEINIFRDLSKKKSVHKIRKLPTLEDRYEINRYLKENHYRFWLFMQIFFHSGARLTELIRIKRSDISLEDQYFKITVKKGSSYKEIVRPIKTIALTYWKGVTANASPDDYIFSKGLVPGKAPIQSYQITKRWNRHIKKKMGIQEDFYSLKHLNLDQTAELLGIEDASKMASHSSTQITTKFYALGEKQRQNERLKGIQNKFSD